MNISTTTAGGVLSFADPKDKLEFTGERYVSGHLGPTQHAHHHRYLVAVPFCVGMDVLDVASGEGYGADLLAQVAKSVTGVDIDPNTVSYATRQYARPGLRFINATATSIPLANESFDVVVSYETIEHLEDQSTFLDEIRRVLRPGGLLIISSPNRPIYSDKARYDNPFHVKELDLEEFRILLSDRFANVQMLAQRQITGSLLTTEDANGQQIEIYTTEDGLSYHPEEPLETPQYFVALASDRPIGELPSSALTNQVYVPKLQEENAYRIREVAAESNRNRELKQKLQEGQQSLHSLKMLESSHAELRDAVANLAAGFGHAKERSETSHAELRDAVANLAAGFGHVKERSETSHAELRDAVANLAAGFGHVKERSETSHAELRDAVANLAAGVGGVKERLDTSFGTLLGAAVMKVSIHIRHLVLFIRAYIARPLSRRKRRIYIQRHLERADERFANSMWLQMRALDYFKWKFKAVRRYPFSSHRRKKWRQDKPFWFFRDPLPNEAPTEVLGNDTSTEVAENDTPTELVETDTSADLVVGSTLHSRLYENWVSNALGDYPAKEYVAITRNQPLGNVSDVRFIAYYLPQFHPIPENDAWWGKGFTEWRNVARAFPNFEGHYQPRIPGELGYYDLRIPQVMQRQVELAKLYGISAFCFHFYWFAGKTLLEGPITNYFENKDLDLPFCLCWANENWSRRWDGSEHEVLIAQQHSPEDDEAFLRYIGKYFADERYVKVDGRPVLTVYRPSLLPDPGATVARWRRIAKEMGYPDLYLIATNSFGFKDYADLGFDALSEFPPHHLAAENVQPKMEMTSLRTGWRVRQYEDVVRSEKARDPGNGRIHPGLTIGWDNSARKPTWGDVIHDASPALFKEWLEHCVLRTKRNPASEQFVFINAWNEWAEGTYLEPDKRFGYAFLETCAKVLKENVYGAVEQQEILAGKRIRLVERPTILVCSHHAGRELFGAERSMLDVIEAIATDDYNVVVTLPERANEDYISALLEIAMEVRIFPYKQWTRQNEASLASVPDFMATIRDVGADLVYVNTIVLRSPVEAARFCGVPAVIHAREIIAADRFLQEQMGMPGEKIAEVVARSCSHIVANSVATAESYPNSTTISIVPNIVDVTSLDVPNMVSDNLVRFGLISSNLPKKGIDDLVELARRCETEVPDARFLVIGPFWREGVRDFISGTRKAPKNVEFVDYIPSSRDALIKVNVVLNLSHFQESFGRTVLEAMAASRPVIVYDWGALPELVEDEVTGFVVPFRDIGAAVTAVRQLVNVSRLEEMSVAARRRALQISDRPSFNRSIGNVLEQLLADGIVDLASSNGSETPAPTGVGTTVDIVICVHNALDDVKNCLASVDRYRGANHQIFLVDDGSDAETANFLRAFAEERPSYVDLHRNELATGYTKAANTGVNLTNADVVILLNSDTIVTSNWAEKIADALVGNPGVGIAGPMSNAASYQSLPSVESTSRQTALNVLRDGWGPEEMNVFCEEHATLPLPYVPLIHGFCLAIKRETWNTVGPFDEEAFPRGFGEENDFCFRAADAGFGMVLVTNTFVHHSKSKSYGENTRHELAEAAQKVVYTRHGKERFMNAVRILRNQPQLRKLRTAASALKSPSSTVQTA